MIEVGGVYRASVAITDANGAPTNAATISLVFTLPADSITGIAPTQTVTVPNPPATTGTYYYDFVPTVPGRHSYRFASTGPTAVHSDSFNVSDNVVTPYIIGLADARNRLTMSSLVNDEQLREIIAAATPVVEDIIGAVIVRSYSEVHELGHDFNWSYNVQSGFYSPWRPQKSQIVLHTMPAIALTSMVNVLNNGISYDPTLCDLDKSTGIVRQLNGQLFTGPLRVTYIAGRPIIGDHIIEGTKIIIQHMWDTKRGNSMVRSGIGPEDLSPTPSGFLVPRRALELLDASPRIPTIA